MTVFRLIAPLILVLIFTSCGLKFKKFDSKKVVEKDDVAILMEEGNLLFKQEQHEAALLKFIQAKSIDPNRTLLNYNIGACYFAMEKYPESIKSFTDELTINKRDAYAYMFRGHAYTKVGLDDKAMQDAELALQLTDHAMAYYVIGLAYYNKGQYQMALDKFNAAVYKDPLDYLYYVDRGETYLKLEKSDKACQDFKQAKKIRPTLNLDSKLAGCE
jgi:tetratricopeptide (TPR) repeat protein